MIHIGIAGWSIRRERSDLFGAGESHLARYATRFNAVEINSSFYRPHRPATYAKWAASAPRDFRFAVKMPRSITHEKRLRDAGVELARFAGEAGALGEKLGPVLIQLPPSLAFDAKIARAFFAGCRDDFAGLLACEPRHASWFADGAERMLEEFRIARVAADPARVVPEAAAPGGWRGFAYWRLHGSPRMYYSAYEPAFLESLARDLKRRKSDAWCIFDNTALGAATDDALQTARLLGDRSSCARAKPA
jgi:uncharacterized protein YecE (DUF72 family)